MNYIGIKKIILFVLLLLSTHATGVYAQTGTQQNVAPSTQSQDETLSREAIVRYIGDILLADIPNSYQYISLNFTDVKKGTKLYSALQKMVYVDVMENKKIAIKKEQPLPANVFYSIIEQLYGVNIAQKNNAEQLKNRNTSMADIVLAQKIYQQSIEKIQNEQEVLNMLDSVGTKEELNKFRIFFDAYNTLLSEHYDSSKLKGTDLTYGAISGLTQSTGDQFTTFFPPSESQDFNESLSGEFEGIGAYVDMEKPGELKIISAISGTPAEQAGLKGGDTILKIDGNEITSTTTASDAVKMIKGKAGTIVKLTIKRGEETFEIEVTRAKITIKDVDYKVLNDSFFYIQIRMFGDKVFEQFKQSIDELKKQPNVKKIIIDLRNNPGGYLDQVTHMLSLFVPKNEPTAVVKYKQGTIPYLSSGENAINLNDYEVYVLVDSGTASASEIMVGTLKDYFPNIKIVGEQTYGKGSVQTVRTYYDGSSLKYTIARWFTGKTQTGIDKVGITPDVKLEADKEKMKTGEDNQLNYILNGGK